MTGGSCATSPGKNDELSLLLDDDNTPTTSANDDDVDPWALLAAAASDRENNDSGATTTMTHSEGEVFTLPPGPSSPSVDYSSSSYSTSTTVPPFLASIATRLHDVDEQYLNLSTRIRELDDAYQLTDKLAHYNDEVIKPVAARAIERTSIAAVNARERASVVSARLSERALRIAEEHERRSGAAAVAATNTEGRSDDDIDNRGKQWKEGIIDMAIPAKERVLAGVGWLRQRIQETRDRQQRREQQQQQQDYSTTSTTTTTTTSTSFTRDAVEERLREREKQRREEFNN